MVVEQEAPYPHNLKEISLNPEGMESVGGILKDLGYKVVVRDFTLLEKIKRLRGRMNEVLDELFGKKNTQRSTIDEQIQTFLKFS